jgi:hypothetical protein
MNGQALSITWDNIFAKMADIVADIVVDICVDIMLLL